MLRGDGEYGHADAVKCGGIVFLGDGVHFVRGDNEGFAGRTEQSRELFVHRRETDLAVHYQDQEGGFANGDVGLAQNLLRDESFVVRDNAASIDDLQIAAAPFGFAVNAVARDAGLVGNDGAARASKTIEQRGLPYIGTSDDNERW